MGCVAFVITERSSDDEALQSWEESEISYWGKKSSTNIQNNGLSRINESFRIKSSKTSSFFGKGWFQRGTSTGIWAGRSYFSSSINPTSCSTLVPTPISQITSQLFLGSLEDARNERELRTRKITHIISLIGASHSIKGMSHEHSPMNDYGRSDLNCVFQKLLPFIEESQKPPNVLFVHCMSGQNRSAALVIAILMKIHCKTLRDAFRMLKSKRPIVQINVLYAKQLIKMEVELFGKGTMPKNWMEINFVNVETGSVIFFGDDMYSNNNLRKLNIYKKNGIRPRRSSSMRIIRENALSAHGRCFSSTC